MVPRVESQGQRDRTGDSVLAVLVIVWGPGSERAAAPAGCGACDGAAVSIIHRKGPRDGGALGLERGRCGSYIEIYILILLHTLAMIFLPF